MWSVGPCAAIIVRGSCCGWKELGSWAYHQYLGHWLRVSLTRRLLCRQHYCLEDTCRRQKLCRKWQGHPAHLGLTQLLTYGHLLLYEMPWVTWGIHTGSTADLMRAVYSPGEAAGSLSGYASILKGSGCLNVSNWTESFQFSESVFLWQI